MKKFLMMAVAAFGMLATACSKDEVAQPVAEKSTVTFSVAAPELATRAEHGDGTLAKNLTYAVYNRVDGAKLFDGTATMNTELKATVEIPFVNGMTYDVLFWAESENSPYSVNWTAKTVGYANASALVSNSKDYDAFYAYVNDIPEITGPVTKTVELKRPFAQLNIKTNDAAKAAQSGVTVKDVKVVVKKGYSSFDLVDGTGEDQGDVTFGFATTETTTDLLAVNYLFTGGEKSLVDVEFTYTDVNGKVDAAGEVMEFASVPVQRNYRTNIVGSLLTSEGTFNFEIKPGFATEEHEVEVVTVNTAEDLKDAIENGDADQIIIGGDIDLGNLLTRASVDDHLTIAKDRKLTLDLGGYNLTGVDKTAKNFGLIQNNGTLSIVNSGANASKMTLSATTNSGWSRYSAVISNNPGATLTVGQNVVVEHLGGTDMSYGIDILTNGGNGDVKATIDGATVKSTYRAIRQFLNSNSKKNELVINAGSVVEGESNGVFFHDPSTKANNGKLTIAEGASVNGVYLFVTAGSTEWPVEVSIAASAIGEKGVTSANVPAGYAVVEQNGVWGIATVSAEDYAVQVGAQGYNDLQKAIEAVKEGETIVLLQDITLEETVTVAEDKTLTLSLNGKTLAHADVENKYAINNLGTLTIKNGTVSARGIYNGYGNGGENVTTAKIIVESGTYNAMGTNGGAAIFNYGIAEIKGGKFESNGGYGLNNQANGTMSVENAEVRGGIYNLGSATINANVYQHLSGKHAIYNWAADVTINGGKFDSESGNELILADGENSSVTINDGTFNKTAKSWLYGAATGKNITFVIKGGTHNGYVNLPENTVDAIRPYGDPIVVEGGTFNFDVTPWCAEGYGVVKENGKWVVKELAVASTYEALVEALALGGEITLGADITLTETLEVAEGMSVALNLNGKTLKNKTENGYALNNYGTLVIEDSAKSGVVNGIVWTAKDAATTIKGGTYNAVEGGAYVLLNSSGTLTIDNATINGGSSYPVYSYNANNKLVINDATINATFGCINSYTLGATVEINGGTYNMTGVQGKTSHIAYFSNGDVVINGGSFNKIGDISMSGTGGGGVCVTHGANLTVNGGDFAGAGAEKEGYIYNYGGQNDNGRKSAISIQGGTYKTKPTIIAAGYKAVQNQNGTWSVIAE